MTYTHKLPKLCSAILTGVSFSENRFYVISHGCDFENGASIWLSFWVMPTKVDPGMQYMQAVGIKISDQLRFLGNCPPTPPLTQR